MKRYENALQNRLRKAHETKTPLSFHPTKNQESFPDFPSAYILRFMDGIIVKGEGKLT